MCSINAFVDDAKKLNETNGSHFIVQVLHFLQICDNVSEHLLVQHVKYAK
jgi:hypothetical protein